MSYRIYMKVLAAVLFVTIAVLVAFSMDASFWISSHLFSPRKSAVDSLETIHVAQYDYGKTTPIVLGEIKAPDNTFVRLKLRKPDNAYVRLKLRFRAESTEGNPNLFQTAPVNRGMRLEISGSTAAIVVPDSSAPNGLKGITLTTALKTGQWYQLEVEALNHSFVRATLDGLLVANYTGPTLSMETSELLVGGGFDASRIFRGQIENISVTKGSLSDSSSVEFPLENPKAIRAAQYTYGLDAESVKTFNAVRYDSSNSQPLALGEIKNPDNAYLRLKLRFRAQSTEGNPNLFQTAPLNRGMRMEISGSTAAIVVPDSAVPGGLKGLTLTTALKTGQWYELEVEALNHAFVRASLDGLPVANYTGPGLAMETSELLIGGGFDASRAFRGQMEDIAVTKGNFSPPIAFGGVKNPDNAYVRLKFRFRAESTEGNPNLFQTDPVNNGMRLEISGTTATIIVSDLAEKSGLRGLTLSTAIKTGQWYELEIEALNGAFVRALLDSHPVFNYAGAGLSIASSQILVGGGLDTSRAFRGQIEDIYVISGNLPHLPHQHLLAVYVILALLTALFFFVLWRSLGDHNAAQRMVGKLTLLAFPLLLILGYVEYRLSFVNTLYYTKRVALEQQLDQIEVLTTGSSNGLYGVAPEAFSHRGFNLAFPAHEMYADAKLVEKYYKKMPHLRMVVLTVNYCTMMSDDRNSLNSWRHFFLRQYFGIQTELAGRRLFDWGFWFNPHNFSKIALYGVDTKTQMNTDFLTPVDNITSSSGWFDSGDVDDPSAIFGVNAAAGHNSHSTRNFERNLGHWETLVPLLQRKNIATAMVVPPTDISYNRHVNKANFELMNRKLSDFANRHHIKFVDYTNDARFSSNDFTWEMPDHINARGAMKFSKILDEEIIRWK